MLEGIYLLDYHCDRMIKSAEELAPFFAPKPTLFLQDLIPTRSEITTKLETAIHRAGKDNRQRLRVLLDFEGAITIQSSRLPSETSSFSETPKVIVLDSVSVPRDNIFLRYKTTQRAVYDEARERAKVPPVGTPSTDPNSPFDVLLFNEDNEITETTIANIAIETQDGVWITPPMSSGLLAGTMRRKLLEEGKLKEQVIMVDDLRKAVQNQQRIKCFNSVRKEYPVLVKL
ncbi:hypothetical protein BGZ73_006854 [Actinomortierella ambigua]|nr:hypothetical protein BGZ73_006854 [Actinomortierella ambigua]